MGSPHNSGVYSLLPLLRNFSFFYTVGSSHNAKWVFSFLPRNHDSGIDSPTTIGLRPPHQKLTAVCKKCLLLPTTRPARFQPQHVYVMPPLQGFSSHKEAAPPPRLHMHHKTHMLWEKHTIWVLRCQDGWETWETWGCGRGLGKAYGGEGCSRRGLLGSRVVWASHQA